MNERRTDQITTLATVAVMALLFIGGMWTFDKLSNSHRAQSGEDYISIDELERMEQLEKNQQVIVAEFNKLKAVIAQAAQKPKPEAPKPPQPPTTEE